MMTWRLLLLTLAFALFLVAAYLSTDLASKLTHVAFALLVLAWVLQR
jgi:hypothetical protein